MPSTTSIRAVSRSGRAAGRPAPRTPCPVRAGRHAAVAIATRAPSGALTPVPIGRTRQAAGRSHELAARDRLDLVRRQDDHGKGVEAGVERSQERDEARRPVLGGRSDHVERRRAVERERTGGGPGQRAEVGSAAEARPEVPGERADVGPGRAGDVDDRDRPVRVGVVPGHEVERVDRDLARRELDRLARPRHRVRPAAADLDRAVRRRALRDRAGQPGSAASTACARRRRSVGRRELALEVVGRR